MNDFTYGGARPPLDTLETVNASRALAGLPPLELAEYRHYVVGPPGLTFDDDAAEWNALTNYVARDAVTDAGSLWRARRDTVGERPSESPGAWLIVLEGVDLAFADQTKAEVAEIGAQKVAEAADQVTLAAEQATAAASDRGAAEVARVGAETAQGATADLLALTEVVAANAQASALTCATWVALAALTGTYAGQGAEVLDADAGTHTDPVAGGTVSNGGRYSWSVSPAGWLRIGDTGLSAKAPQAALDAEVAARVDLIDDDADSAIVDEAGVAAMQFGPSGLKMPFADLDAGEADEVAFVDEAGVAAMEFGPSGLKMPFADLDAGEADEVAFVDEAGRVGLLVTGDAVETQHVAITPGEALELAFVDEAGNVGLDVSGGPPVLAGLADALPDMFAPPDADLQQPPGRIVHVGGYLRLSQRPAPLNPNPWVQLPPVVVRATDQPQWGARRWQMAPSICVIGARWWAMWYGSQWPGTMSPHSEGRTTYGIIAYSDDSGASWTDALYILPRDIAGAQMLRIWDQTLVNLDGRLYCRFLYGAGTIRGTPGYLDGYPVAYAVTVENPQAAPDRLVVSRPSYAGEGISYNPFRWDGGLYLPRSIGQAGYEARMMDRAGRYIDRLHPDGTLEPVLLSPREANPGHWDWDERQIVQLQTDSRLWCTWRSKAGIYQSTYDGETWSAPSLWSGIVPQAVSKHWMARSPSGRLVCVLNNSASRTNMIVALSEDDGATWPVGMRAVLRPDTSAYPVGDFTADGRIVVAYDVSRQPPWSSIRGSVVDEEALASGNTTTSFENFNISLYEEP